MHDYLRLIDGDVTRDAVVAFLIYFAYIAIYQSLYSFFTQISIDLVFPSNTINRV